MSDTQPWTIKRLLEWTVDYLAKRDAENPRLDAEVLLAHALQCQRIELYTRFDEVPQEEPLGRYRDFVKSRAQGKPVAYLVGRKEFFSLDFGVTSDVLIPRPETEFVVLEAEDFARQWIATHPDISFQLIDVGTGSGCLAVTLAKQLPTANVFATDISSAALAVAQRNAEKHQVEERIDFQERDVLDDWPADKQVPLIVSNPPYIGESERSTVDPHVLAFEPEQALFAAEEGLAIVRKLLKQAADVVVPEGRLLIEISPVIVDRVQQLAEESTAWQWLGCRKDLSQHPRVVKLGRRAS